ncbi:Oidioi.mRNA.OKI2018_I69.PAR.g9688.t1.cds [Oikopleura dioica]|uniref:Oidioi.mRNA.OKI2018_I69.PAR.g9688.t1.cds n=1 Tax=Oikopleura dioica TaxID=34765 RepID=A0ABN7RLQ1_OIKDI|nr:Oidioi.mRNA.OKI2018_I69.PAR.g9688.t1.cds [Oikopleura dioica]
MADSDKQALIFFVNGKRIEDFDADPEETLLYYLRNRLRLCGTKSGCGEGGCGACTAMISNYRNGKVIHRAINACLTPLPFIHLSAITTIEGIGSTKTKLHRIQQVLIDNHGTQCGFCTPGIVMSMYALLRNEKLPTEEMIKRALQGNLCRCTGYRPILQGFNFEFAAKNQEEKRENGPCALGESCCKNKPQSSSSPEKAVEINNDFIPEDPTQEPIFPPELKLLKTTTSFTINGPRTTWFAPTEFVPLIRYLKENQEVRIISGGTICALESKFEQKFRPIQISTAAVEELKTISMDEFSLRIGAGATITEISEFIQGAKEKNQILDSILESAKWFGGEQVRNVATIGGNIMSARATSDLTTILMAAGAQAKYTTCELTDHGTVYFHDIDLDNNFFPGERIAAIPKDSVLYEVNLSLCPKTAFFRSYKQSKRKENDTAIVNAAFFLDFNENSSTIKTLRMAFGGVAKTVRLAKCADSFVGRSWDEKLLKDVSEALQAEFDVSDFPVGYVAYRKCLITSFFFKFFITVNHELGGEKNQIGLERGSFSSIRCADVDHSLAPVGKSTRIISAAKQATGEAQFLDDMPKLDRELYFAPVLSPKAHAKILFVDFTEADALQGVVGHVTWEDVRGGNEINDEEYFRKETVTSTGQIIAGILADDEKTARRAAKLVKIEYEVIEPVVVTIEDAIKFDKYLPNAPSIRHDRGDPDAAYEKAEHRIESSVRFGSQEHFYLETQGSYCIPIDNSDEFHVISSCQNILEGQSSVARVLNVPMNHVKFSVKRLGGGFGGKEMRFRLLCGGVAVAAQKFNRPVRCALDREEDMLYSGGRHSCLSKYKVGFESSGKITSVSIDGYANAGYSEDVSIGMLSRYIDHCFNCYHFPNYRVVGHCMMTNTRSNTAFRGTGGPPGMLVAEDIVHKVADYLKMPVDDVRKINMLKRGDRLPYGPCDKQLLDEDHILEEIYEKANESFKIDERRKIIKKFNEKHQFTKKGVALVPIMFGLGFGLKHLNSGGALVQIYTDGSVLVAHGGIEMGQGLYTKMIQIASKELGVPMEKIHTLETCSTTVPNAAPTAASVSSDHIGFAVKKACEELRERLSVIDETDPFITWEEKIKKAYLQRISLSASAFGQSSRIEWDPVTRIGRKYNYYCYGVCGSEVEVDLLTGDHIIREVEILMDIGKSLNPAVDIGQIEGAFIQGVGLMTLEEELFKPEGEQLTKGPGSYKIPAFGDIPEKFKVSLFDKTSNRHGLFHSKVRSLRRKI